MVCYDPVPLWRHLLTCPNPNQYETTKNIIGAPKMQKCRGTSLSLQRTLPKRCHQQSAVNFLWWADCSSLSRRVLASSVPRCYTSTKRGTARGKPNFWIDNPKSFDAAIQDRAIKIQWTDSTSNSNLPTVMGDSTDIVHRFHIFLTARPCCIVHRFHKITNRFSIETHTSLISNETQIAQNGYFNLFNTCLIRRIKRVRVAAVFVSHSFARLRVDH